MEKYGVANTDPLSFCGFKNYTKQQEEITKAIEDLLLYLKLRDYKYYFEHNDFETDEYVLEDYYNYIYNNPVDKKKHVKMDWIVIGFDCNIHRIPSKESEQDDLVIAIDVFDNGKSKLRIHYPDCYKDKFQEHFKQCGYEDDGAMVSIFNEKKYVEHIKSIIGLL